MENINKDKEIIVKDIFGTLRKKHHIFRSGDFYHMAIYEYFDTEIGKKISNFLNKKTRRLTGEGISYRVINHWESIGLLTSERDSEKGWRKYSIIDVIWISVIATLRQFGFPLEKISKVKYNLEMPEWDRDLTQFPFFEILISMALFRRIAVYLLVFPNGEAEPVMLNEYLASEKILRVGDHVRISINDILQKMYPKKDLSVVSNTPIELSNEEMELLYMIRMQDFESIKIKTTDGKIINLEATEILKNEKRIIDILSESDYQDIEIKKSGGKINYIRRTRKMKYDNEK